MDYWHKLTIEEAVNSYRIPQDVVENEGNSFYGVKFNPFDSDGPWPILAFLKQPEDPEILIFQIFKIFPEALEREEFNPLTSVRGYLYSRKQPLIELISLLESMQVQISESDGNLDVSFERLGESELNKYRLTPELFPNSRIEYYRQLSNPPSDESSKAKTTILLFSTSIRENPPQKLFFQILQFDTDRLDDLSFNPLDHSIARINLVKHGVTELISLIGTQLKRIE